MKVVTNPEVIPLAEGKSFIAKQMSANAGEFLPKHRASAESVLVMQTGICVMHLEGTEHILNSGDVFIIPANVIHQIEAKQDFAAVHIMPKEIKFEFFK